LADLRILIYPMVTASAIDLIGKSLAEAMEVFRINHC
jgi:hypothetical protein